MATVKQLIAGAKLISPAMVRRHLAASQATKDRRALKPERVVAKPPVTLNKALVPTKAGQTLKATSRSHDPGLTAMQRPEPLE